jgi:hypothetical protein
MLHTYLICSMEPELYDLENNQGEDYSRDEWYYQNPLNNEEEGEEYDMDELPYDYMSEYDDDYYQPEREI